jgi:putative ABC transport system permease protein
MYWYNIKMAFRSFSKHKWYTLINLFGLTIGLAVAIFIFRYTMYERSFDTFHTNYRNIYRAYNPDNHNTYYDYKIGEWIWKTYPEIKAFCKINIYPHREIIYKTNAINCDYLVASDSVLFQVFSFKVLEGDAKNPFHNPNSIVLTKSMASRLFGNEESIGKTVIVDHKDPLIVSAILQDIPTNSSLRLDAVVCADKKEFQNRINGTINNKGETINQEYVFGSYFLIDKSSNKQLLETKINLQLPKFRKDPPKISLQPIKEIYFDNENWFDGTVHGNKKILFLLISLAVAVLVIACINYINLSTAKGLGNTIDTGVRKTIGASRRNIIKQYLTESIIIAVVASVLASTCCQLSITTVSGFMEIPIDLKWTDQILLFAFIFGIAISVGIFSGVYPGIYLSSFAPIKVLKGRSSDQSKGGNLRQVLIVFQFSVSIILLVAVITFRKQMFYVRMHDLGFNTQNLIYIDIPQDIKEKYFLSSKISELPGVASTCLTGGKPIDIWNKYSWKDSTRERFAMQLIADTGFIKNTEIKLIDGRTFNYSDPADKYFIANEAFMKQMNWTDIDNKSHNNKKLIGVVKDFHFKPLYEKIDPLIIDLGDEEKWCFNTLNVRLQSKNYKATLLEIEKIWKSMLPDYVFNYGTYDDWISNQYKKERTFNGLLILFASLTVLISCLGILGLTAFIVERRTKEIGIRRTNGANIFNIVTMLLNHFTKLIILAFIISCPIAWYIMNHWLQNFAYHTEISWWIYTVAGTVALIIALLTVSIQSWRAATRNPVEALRYE